MTRNIHRGVIKSGWLAALVLVAGLAVVAWSRVGLFDLPSVPVDVSLAASGLGGLAEMKQLDDAIHASQSAAALPPAARLVCQGLALVAKGRPQEGLETMRSGIRLDPENLVLANAYRMTAFRLRRDFLNTSKRGVNPTPTFPAYLDKEPIAFFEALSKDHPTREAKLSLALAWVDLMLLFQPLEIKAPASVESVKVLTSVLDKANTHYVPALYARGLNHLHRPSRLVWPEADKTPPDAAVQDISRCIAVGRRIKVGSPRLQATLAIALGDSYVKVGRLNNARSWWQLAQNLCRDGAVQQAVRRRYAWRDEEILDRLEEELDRARAALDEPMTDLRIMWDPS